MVGPVGPSEPLGPRISPGQLTRARGTPRAKLTDLYRRTPVGNRETLLLSHHVRDIIVTNAHHSTGEHLALDPYPLM